ncbi:T9SS type A sorting domain-containing protein [Mesonia ostreae]|uniref:T9SS type A sorting domain-containing protein n=1 Tax=Mesonia ostreae TaxID=861110 RepID=A0ABU2KM47_9FLAO|nr:T9SS type A sorting domain-containing protein [Mesonia ostreae]MDT0295800.1 T9SS type A sorting domain-containing protein [Mesonia ostreae]
MKKLLPLTVCFLFIIAKVQSQVPASERNALIAIYNALDGDNWDNNQNWNTTAPVDTWEFVNTSMINGQEHVVSLNFGYNSDLSGSFPPEFTDLTELKLFIASNGSLTGSIPNNLGDLTKLETFGVDNNQLTGSIPASIANCTQLTALALRNNFLSGNIPDLTGLPNLDIFWIPGNYFEFGDFEDEFTSYSTLNFEYENQRLIGDKITEIVPVNSSYTLISPISGNNTNYEWYHNEVLIPGATSSTLQITINSTNDYGDYVSKATNTVVTGSELESKIIMLDDSPNNKPEYPFLVQFYNNTNGDNWNDNTNWLDNTKTLQDWNGIDMKNGRLNSLRLTFNNLEGGPIPSNIDLLSDAETIRLDLNKITGSIPSSIGNITTLKTIWLDFNHLSGTIPSSIGNLSNLEIFTVAFCGLTGEIPQSFENLTNLYDLYIIGKSEGVIQNGTHYPGNTFYGDIPDMTGSPLSFFYLQQNQFEFADIADEYDYYVNNIQQFSFNPQFTTDTEDDLYIEPGDDITLTVNYEDPAERLTTNSTYQWYKDDVLIAGATSSLYSIQNAQIADSGDYYCTIINSAYPDFEIQRRMIHLNVGTFNASQFQNEVFTFYPNPVKETLNIKLHQQEAQLQFYNLQGRLVLEKENSVHEELEINLSSLEAGTYFLKVRLHNGTTSIKKIVKE